MNTAVLKIRYDELHGKFFSGMSTKEENTEREILFYTIYPWMQPGLWESLAHAACLSPENRIRNKTIEWISDLLMQLNFNG